MKNNKYIVSASILNANFFNLKKELKKCVKSGIEWIHYDVMDFDFVPNLSFGPKILNDIKKNINIKIDIHFMIKIKTEKIEDFFEPFIKIKPDMMTIHFEALNSKEILDFIKLCEKNNIKKSLAISPKTKVSEILDLIEKFDNILVMSVEPGFGGQSFINDSLKKIKKLKSIKIKENKNFTIQVDGGINRDTSVLVKESGVDSMVVGSFLFENKGWKKDIKKIINE